ncbi:response regulator transcription factor [Corynebacterium canis]|uniref:Response regulator transcription factor n=1 Tax=Corynebacterium canis TaxID=679663 RepID=A0A5C5UMA8_9CORY|nr:response regulator transcription factor [Corynebacterium canis]TWT26822.1 response regulator transcription factor [Corynebacterium canis]WJY74464.1 Response regulator protein VraR [Corynebacterium canis]
MTIRVLLADDQPLLLSALATILNSQPDIEVAATCADGHAAVSAIRSEPIDIAILDIRMPVLDGIGALQEIRRIAPQVRVLMLTTFNVPDLIERALAAGAHGFLLKDAEPEVLLSAVRSVYRGESVLSSGVTGHVIEAWRRKLNNPAQPLAAEVQQGLSLLTPREAEILTLIAQGKTNPEIAKQLVISGTTVKTHVSHLLSKLHCRDRIALVILAREAGLHSE